MATKPYEIEYTDGRVRVKLLSPDGAERIRERSDVKDVRLPDDEGSHAKQRSTAANK